MPVIDDSKLVAHDVINNTGFFKFLGKTLPTNETASYSAVPLVRSKTVSHDIVLGEYQTLTYKIVVVNKNGFKAVAPFFDPLLDGQAYIDDSFKVNGQTQTPEMVGDVLHYDAFEVPAHGRATIEFQCRARYTMHEGQ